MLETIVRSLAESLIRLYYPERIVENAEALPAVGPVIFVANHPNGLLDPLVLRVTFQVPVQALVVVPFAALGELGTQRSVPMLEAAAGHENATVAAEAKKALEAIKKRLGPE